jgi:hypothetical protein
MSLPPHRYPGYYSLPSMVIEKAVVDRTVLAPNRFMKNGNLWRQHSPLQG